MLCYHYTKGFHVPSILRDGELIQATAGVPVCETPAVWFTIDPDAQEIYPAMGTPIPAEAITMLGPEHGVLEVGKYHPESLTVQEKHEACGIVRFTVDELACPITWREHKRDGGIPTRVARGLYQQAIRDGDAPTRWRLSYDPVPEREWLSIDVWNGSGWEPMDDGHLECFRILASEWGFPS